MMSIAITLLAFDRALLFLLLLGWVSSAPTNPSSAITQALNLEITGQDPQGPLALAGLPPIVNLTHGNKGNCASANKYSSWKAQDWIIEDCYSAVYQLYMSEVFTHPNEQFEFTARGAAATKPNLKTQKTPRKYVNSKARFCLAIKFRG